ncbi:hypothetical protein PG991_006639 [Apiospora marii]|uniref:Heterokaryon incompatibility domain-containing protein n=1 Tax=Apiospora marii TaxID=335849 RepID=A0ABR1RZQ2_9PEZI
MEPSLPFGGTQKRDMAGEEDMSPARKRLLLSVPAEDEPALCNRCRDIQWEDLAEIPPASRTGRKAADLGMVDRNALRQSPCPVCRLLADITPRRLHGQHCRLVALSSSLAVLGRRVGWFERVDYSDCTVLFPVPEAKFADATAGQRIKRDWYAGGCLALVGSGDNENEIPITGPRRILPTTVDFGLVGRWVRDCETHHRGTCEPGVGGSGEVEGLRVIDCHIRRPIEAPAMCRYVALSYVWGKRLAPYLDQKGKNPTQADTVLPRVVTDAIDVTVALGERYLWVDQMCIDQDDDDMKASQVAQMDKIYAHAYLTLVAAAGQDSSYGLPGVGDKQRHPQGHVHVAGAVDMIQIFPHTSSELNGSTWARRGWTYQEGYMSHRRLIFTDRQVSYLCNTAHQAETVRKPKRLSRSELIGSKTAFLDILPTVAPAPSGSLGLGRGDVWDDLKRNHLPSYTRRQLTDDHDSLNAILGLFRTLQPEGIRHIHGTPLRMVQKGEDGSRLEFPLAWHHEVQGARRRHQFPSWSWTGWEGAVRMKESDICVPDDCEVGLVDGDGRVVSLQDWYKQAVRSPDVLSENTPLLLRVTAPVVHVQCVRKSWSKLNENLSRMSRLAGMSFADGAHAVLPICKGVTQMAYAYMDENVSLDHKILGLVLRPPLSSRKNAIILLKQDAQQKEHYRRIGLVRISGFAKTRPAAVGDSDPQTVYVDGDGLPLDEVEQGDQLPIWLEGAVETSLTIS